MRIRVPAVVFAISASLLAIVTSSDAATGADRPIFLQVVGHGAIRFRLARGSTAPCDSLDDSLVFDGWVGPGWYVVPTGAEVVCYQHTSGALRDANWSLSLIVPTMVGGRRSGRPRPTELRVETD